METHRSSGLMHNLARDRRDLARRLSGIMYNKQQPARTSVLRVPSELLVLNDDYRRKLRSPDQIFPPRYPLVLDSVVAECLTCAPELLYLPDSQEQEPSGPAASGETLESFPLGKERLYKADIFTAARVLTGVFDEAHAKDREVRGVPVTLIRGARGAFPQGPEPRESGTMKVWQRLSDIRADARLRTSSVTHAVFRTSSPNDAYESEGTNGSGIIFTGSDGQERFQPLAPLVAITGGVLENAGMKAQVRDLLTGRDSETDKPLERDYNLMIVSWRAHVEFEGYLIEIFNDVFMRDYYLKTRYPAGEAVSPHDRFLHTLMIDYKAQTGADLRVPVSFLKRMYLYYKRGLQELPAPKGTIIPKREAAVLEAYNNFEHLSTVVRSRLDESLLGYRKADEAVAGVLMPAARVIDRRIKSEKKHFKYR